MVGDAVSGDAVSREELSRREGWVPRSILCPVDFSETSREALHTASALARVLGASLNVLHVVDDRLGFPVVPTEVFERLRRELQGQGQERLDSFVRETLGGGSPMPECRLAWGPAPEEILRASGELSADLIVIGMEGRSVLGRLAMGSVAERVVRLASIPVLSTRFRGGKSQGSERSRIEARSEAGQGVAMRRILVGCDFSVHAARVLPMARRLAETFAAKLVLAHVVVESPVIGDPIGTPFPVDFWTQFKRRSREQLDAWADEHLGPATPHERVIVAASSAADGIVAEARRSKADLIVLATHGWGWIHRAVVGSTAARLLRRSPCPVLTLRPEEDAFAAHEHEGDAGE